MSRVSFNNRAITIDGEWHLSISGAIHYSLSAICSSQNIRICTRKSVQGNLNDDK